MSTLKTKRNWRERIRAKALSATKKAGLAVTAMALALGGVAGAGTPAHADEFPGQAGPGYLVDGILASGPVWFGALQNPRGGDWLAWCTQAGLMAPLPGESVSAATLTAVEANGQPADLTVTTPQVAWIFMNKESIATAESRAAISFLVHTNYETGNGSIPGPMRVGQILPTMQTQHPSVVSLARQYVSEAKASGIVDYKQVTIEGENTRKGNIHGIGALNNEGNFVAGTDVEVTLNGPAVFKSTGTNTWKGKTQASGLTLEWESTGNGTVTFSAKYKSGRKTLTKLGADGSKQDTLTYGHGTQADPEWANGKGVKFDVIYDFQPMLTSNVADARIIDDGKLSDVLTTKADSNYGDGKWLELDSGFVPVTFVGTAYYTGLTPPSEGDAVPGEEMIVGKTTITANGPEELKAQLENVENVKPNFINWQWCVYKDEQTAEVTHGGRTYKASEFVHADWCDTYGLADETTSNRHPAQIDSQLSVRDTKAGTYLVDDVFVTGMPSDHPNFEGAAGFKADEKEISHEVLFFPAGLEVTQANRDKAEKIGETVTIPAKNGFYPSIGDTSWIAKTGADGKLEAGTYVFVSTFAGDDRVQPLATSVEDQTEQFTVTAEPGIHTTLTYNDGKDEAPGYGTRVLIDKVAYTNLAPGKEYSLTGTLMDKETGKPMLDSDGKEITATTTFTPESANGTVTVAFEVDAALFAGKTTVAFEELFQDGKSIAIHADITDENQTITFGPGPKLKTTFTGQNGDKTLTPAKDTKLIDTVCDANEMLTPGVEYTLKLKIHNKTTGEMVTVGGKDYEVTAKFSPQTPQDCGKVIATLDTTGMANTELVAFEYVYDADGQLVGTHEDPNDADQTIKLKASDHSDGGAGRDLARTGATTALSGAAALLLAGGGALTLAKRRKSA